jgi:hypothetical protein
MRWQELACCLIAGAVSYLPCERLWAANNATVRALVPTFIGPANLGANVSTILSLRLWTTLRPRPDPNPNNLYFGLGEVKWSRDIVEDSPQAAIDAAARTESSLVLWGEVMQYGPGVIVTPNLVIVAGREPVSTQEKWVVATAHEKLELALPNVSYQFSPLLLSSEVVEKYSRPNQLRVCAEKTMDCKGPLLGISFRSLKIDGDFALVRYSGSGVGWVALPDLSEAQGEVINFTAAVISYLRGDFEQAKTLFEKVRDSDANSLVRNDAGLLAGVSGFRLNGSLDALRASHNQDVYSRYAVQALVMADIARAADTSGDVRSGYATEAGQLLISYRNLFAPNDVWLLSADRLLHQLN